jgi:methylmalonyl-CoA mutase N-terminal domain/subunit
VARRKASGDKVSVGANRYVQEDGSPAFEIHTPDPETCRRQVTRLRDVMARRVEARVRSLLARLERAAGDERENLMPISIELARAYATLGEMVDALKATWGVYREQVDV